MKILFLEPINVLSSRAHRHKILELNNFRNHDDFISREYEIEKVKMLKSILEQADAQMVLYTSDRCCSQKIGALMHKLTMYGLPDSFWLDTVPPGGEQYQAAMQWLNTKLHLGITKYAILDNIINGITPDTAPNVFFTDKNEGLTEEVATSIINHLTK